MELVKNYKNPDSPRGPIQIGPATRDIVQNEYILEVRKVGGQLANVEIETIPMVKDLWKEFNKKQGQNPGFDRVPVLARKRRLPRRLLRDDPVCDLRGAVGDDGPHGLHQP